MLDNGTLRRYIDEFSITGLTSNPTIFDEAIGKTDAYDDGIRDKARGREIRRRRCSSSWRSRICAAPPICSGRSSTPPTASTAGSRWKSRRCSPTTPRAAIDAAARIHAQAGAAQSVRQDSRHAGRRSGDRGIDLRRRADQRDAAVLARAVRRRRRGLSARHRAAHRRRARPARRIGRLAVRQPLGQGGERQGAGRAAQSPRHRDRAAAPTARIASCSPRRAGASSPRAGARPQRLLWASTGTKDPNAPDTLYVEALAAPDTIDTMPEKTLRAFAEHGKRRGRDGRGRRRCRSGARAASRKAGIDVDALAEQLQRDGAQAFVKSWKELLTRIADKSARSPTPS